MVQDRSGKQIRRFHVEIAGDVIGDTLTLNEHFVYDDGEKQQRVWHIRRVGSDRYEGTAGDIDGGDGAGGRQRVQLALQHEREGQRQHLATEL